MPNREQPVVELKSLVELKQAAVGLAPPFSVDVPGGQPLVCEEILRHLPGRRLAFRSRWGGKPVMVKLFFRQRDFLQERTGLAAIAGAKIPVPREVGSFRDEGERGGFLLLTEFLEDSVSLQNCYQQQSLAEFAHWLRQAVSLTGQLHQAGYMQADIHLDNFLAKGDRLYLIDGGGVAPVGQPLLNLALLYAQMTPEYDVLAENTLSAYGADVPSTADFLRLVEKMRERRIRHYLAKSTRSCSQFLVPPVKSGFAVLEREFASDRLLKLLAEPEAEFGQAQFLKRGNTATVVKVAGDHGDWVLKRYNIKNFWHGLSRCWRPSRAWISWKSAHRLELLGIRTPRPVAMCEERFGPLRQRAYLVTEYVGDDNLQAWLLRCDGREIPAWLDRQVVQLFDNLWRGSTSHGDMKATNLLVVDEHLELIDLDALQHHRSRRCFIRQFRKDLQRFMDNWQGDTWQHFEELLRPIATRSGITLVNKKV
ncbi:MAG: lipopolysaccharide kinase InaA family protein [Porticoccaceae bacterium]